jgi:hypothetical protein
VKFGPGGHLAADGQVDFQLGGLLAGGEGVQEGAVDEEREELVEGVRECYLAWGEISPGLTVSEVQGSELEGALQSH